MTHNKALGVALMAALSGSLLVGCTSDNATTATSPTPPAELLVGKWVSEAPVAEFPNGGVVLLELKKGEEWTYMWGPSYNRLVVAANGTYKVNPDDTITWTGGKCVEGEPGTYTYTLEGDKFTQMVKDEPCGPRGNAYDGVTYTRETASPSPSTS